MLADFRGDGSHSNTIIPLHVFEPRYVNVDDAMNTHRHLHAQFARYAKDGPADDVHPVAGVGHQ